MLGDQSFNPPPPWVGCAQAHLTSDLTSKGGWKGAHMSVTEASVLQNTFRQQLELEHDAALHRQQLEVDRLNHALRLAQEAHTSAQTDAERLKTKHDQELELCEVPLHPQSTFP